VLILSESDTGSYLAAVDGRSGKPLWRTERRKKVHTYAGNCRTPSVLTIGGRDTLVVWGLQDLSGYDPETAGRSGVLPPAAWGAGITQSPAPSRIGAGST
jgi:hypothetical protein